MGRKQKYEDGILMEAVIKYSETTHMKIKATELAEYARNNIEGLENVQAYHFTRERIKSNSKTGEKEKEENPCKKRIAEINETRVLMSEIKDNMLLRSSNIEQFFDRPRTEQNRQLMEARKVFSKLEKDNVELREEKKALWAENEHMKKQLEMISHDHKKLQKEIAVVKKKLNHVSKDIDEEKGRQILEEIGIKDKHIDLEKYIESLKERASGLNFNKEIGEYYEATVDDDDEIERLKEKFVDDLL